MALCSLGTREITGVFRPQGKEDHRHDKITKQDAPNAPKQRWKILRERVLAMREIWTRDVAQFHGEFVDFEPLWCWPKPIQKPGPKILLGSRSQRCFERVVDYCDGWMPIGRPGEQNDLAEGLGKLRALCERVGRRFDSLELAVIRLPPSEDLAKRLLRMGFKHLIFSLVWQCQTDNG